MPLSFGVEAFEWDRQNCYTTDDKVFIANALTTNKYRIVSMVPYADSAYRDEMAQREYIDNYLSALQALAGQDIHDVSYRDISAPKSVPISRLAVPCVYLSCHVMELVIKKILYCCFNDDKKGHDLKELWLHLCRYLYDSSYVQVSSYSILDTMSSFVRFMSEFSEVHNTKYRYAYDKQHNLSQSKCEYIDVPSLVRYVESFVGQLNTLGANVFHAGIRTNKVVIPDAETKMEEWSFGCNNRRFEQGLYLCEAVCKSQVLELCSFSLDGGDVLRDDAVPKVTYEWLADVLERSNVQGDVAWYCECAYRGAYTLFTGRRTSLKLCVNYDPQYVENDVHIIMDSIWDVLKTMNIGGINA